MKRRLINKLKWELRYVEWEKNLWISLITALVTCYTFQLGLLAFLVQLVFGLIATAMIDYHLKP